MKEFGVTLEEGMGAFADTQEGIDKGRVKAIGKYLCLSFVFTAFAHRLTCFVDSHGESEGAGRDCRCHRASFCRGRTMIRNTSLYFSS